MSKLNCSELFCEKNHKIHYQLDSCWTNHCEAYPLTLEIMSLINTINSLTSVDLFCKTLDILIIIIEINENMSKNKFFVLLETYFKSLFKKWTPNKEILNEYYAIYIEKFGH